MAEAGRIHVVGAGLAGLSAAVASTHRGAQIVVYEAAKQAGGRCRSYHDSLLDLVIDNGNHLVLSGNQAVRRYLRAIGAEDRLAGSPHPEFGFFDVGTGHRWTCGRATAGFRGGFSRVRAACPAPGCVIMWPSCR
jgi:protoporphyrinogen oxidase